MNENYTNIQPDQFSCFCHQGLFHSRAYFISEKWSSIPDLSHCKPPLYQVS